MSFTSNRRRALLRFPAELAAMLVSGKTTNAASPATPAEALPPVASGPATNEHTAKSSSSVGRFATHDDMRALMGTAHNKPAGRRRAPSLMRHVTLWMPTALEVALTMPTIDSEPSSMATTDVLNTANKPPSNTREAWVFNLECFILGVYDKLKTEHDKMKTEHDKLKDDYDGKPSDFPELPPLSVTNFLQQGKKEKEEKLIGMLQNFYKYNEDKKRYDRQRSFSDTGAEEERDRLKAIVRHDAVGINGIWHSMPIEIMVELHFEYVTISVAIDLGYRKVPGILYKCCDPFYTPVHQALKDFDAMMARRYAALKDHEALISDKDKAKLRGAYFILYYTIEDPTNNVWRTLQDELLGPAIDNVGADNLGRRIGDMRGLLLRYRKDKPGRFITRAHPTDDDLRPLKKTATSTPFRPTPPSLVHIIEGHPFGGIRANDSARKTEIIRIVDTIKPFMLADPHLADTTSGKKADNPTELSFSTFFDERGIHASAVSLQNPAPGTLVTPLACLSLITRSEGWEMGRLIDIGNRINTLRLAALYGYRELTEANRELHDVEQEVNMLQRELRLLQTKKGGTKSIRSCVKN